MKINLSKNKVLGKTKDIKTIKVVAIIMCFLLCLLFGGCAKVTYSMLQPDDYTIIQQVKIELDSEDIEAHNANLQEMKTTIENYVETYKTNITGEFLNNLMILRSGTSEEQVLASYLSKAVETATTWAGNTFYYEIKFSAIIDDDTIILPVENVYYYFYTGKFTVEDDGADDDGVESSLTDELFVKVYKETYTTAFDSEMCSKIETAFMDKYGTNGFTLEDVAYVYQYGQIYQRVHSDADSITYQDGMYIHTWNLNDKTQPITMFRNYANPTAWYVVALVCGVLAVGITFIVAKCRQRKSEVNENKIDLNLSEN